jgi:para-aminobenzoate synthetase/4-amino-4-deoxychorismate lyase
MNAVSDIIAGIRFKRDGKNRAENVMIADLLRNDLGKVAGKIKVPRLFEIAKYRKLHQMTSTVTGEMDNRAPFIDIFSSLFPSGSVTGAPKIRAMRIIKELENEERRIYTGTIGYITPQRDMFFNVPIRTLLLEDGAGEMGVGGGIVWDSTPKGEWDEGLLKARFLTDYANNML